MIPTLLFLGFFAFSQAQTCLNETQPIGSLGQGVPGIDGTMIQAGSPYSMIDIDGAAQMPAGIITGLEYRVFRTDRVTFQVWTPVDILQGRFLLTAIVDLNPSDVEEVIEVKGLNIPVESKDRWGFSYNGNGLNVPIKYSVALNEPNEEPYMALECFACAAGKQVGETATFPTTKVQKQFRMRAMMSMVVSTCPPPTASPIECIPPTRQLHPEAVLRADLFRNYDRTVRPAPLGQQLRMTVEFRPNQMISFDGRVLTMRFYIDQRWKDNHFGWCPEDHAQIQDMTIKHRYIWTADFTSFEYQPRPTSTTDALGVLYSDTRVSLIAVYIWNLQCTMGAETAAETQDFRCTVKLGSWVYNASELDFDLFQGELTHEMLNVHSKIKLISATLAKEYITYPCCPDTSYPIISFNVVIRVPKMGHDMNRDM